MDNLLKFIKISFLLEMSSRSTKECKSQQTEFFSKPMKLQLTRAQWQAKSIPSIKISWKPVLRRKTSFKSMGKKMLQTNTKFHLLFSWEVPEFSAEKENSWSWLSETVHASVRSELSWPNKKSVPLLFKWNSKKLLKTLEGSVYTQLFSLFWFFWSVSQLKRVSLENGILARTWQKFWITLS